MARMVKEGKGWVPLEAHQEGLRVARLLAKRIAEQGLSVRKVEELVGWGQKTLQQILNGEQPIRVSHVAAVLGILGLNAGELYRELAELPDSEADEAPRKRVARGASPRREAAKERRTKEELLEAARNHEMVWALLERCRSLRFSDTEGMILAASLAVTLAERPDARQGKREDLVDLKARAWAELGNAHRVANDLFSAEAALARALDFSSHGSGDPLLLAHVMDLTASLFKDQRRFEEAHRLLDWVYAIYRHAGDTHLAARALISKGISAGYALESKEAVALLEHGIPQLDASRDPKLILVAVHALLWCLLDCGKVGEVRGLLHAARELYAAYDEDFDKLRTQWLEGRVAAGLGEDARAEQAFLRVREGFRQAEQPYHAALASLDLAAVWLRQGRTAEIKEAVDEMVAIFRARNIRREAIGGLLMLREALQRDQATAALVQTVAAELGRLERLPGVNA